MVRRARENIRLTHEARKLEQEREKTLLDLHTEKSRIHTILESLPNGVVVTNAQGQVVLMNPAFLGFFDLAADIQTGRDIKTYVCDEGLCSLIMDISRGIYVDYEDIPTYEFVLSDHQYLLARGRPVLGDRHECLGAVITLVDITALKMLDRLKSEFVAKVSHELRSPLSTIHEQLAMVMREVVANTADVDYHVLARAKEKTRGLISLIGDLLDLSRIDSKAICQETKPIFLDEILKSIIDFMKTQATAKGQSLSIELPPSPFPTITADPLALESIFGNLITNAIQYTPDGGRIVVKVELTDLNFRVMVIDNGFGIEARHLDKIFDRFYRVKTDLTRYITGTGLGLPIVKELVESLGGILEVESTPGRGSTFSVMLPIDQTAVRPSG